MGIVADLQSEWARLIVGSLVQAGLRDVIVSPGSRSTPFVIAALEQDGLRCTSAIDERSAAHFGLGQARSTGRPSLLICTSGSAPANYWPAVVEANEAGVPLVVLSADRPPELLGCGANQATDQVHLYGRHVRSFANLGEPRGDLESLRAVRRTIIQAIAAAVGPKPGPVHLNAQARKPLEPSSATTTEATDVHARVEGLLGRPVIAHHHANRLSSSTVERVARAIDEAERPVILCGPAGVGQSMAANALAKLSKETGALVLAEASSQFRFGSVGRMVVGGFDAIWGAMSAVEAWCPDFVLQLGASPISRGWEQLNAVTPVPRIVVHPWAWADPSSSAEALVQSDVPRLVDALQRRQYERHRRDADFADRFLRAERTIWDAAQSIVQGAGEALTEAVVGRLVVGGAPERSALYLGNSLPIRNVDRWVPPCDKELRVFCQRGVSGIDGVVSGAAGVGSCEHHATTLLIGDVSFLHDLNGLELASRASTPLVVVVINNGGGRIFEQLPIARQGAESWLPFFTTPHDASLASAASVYGCRFQQATEVGELRRAIHAAHAHRGCTIIEAIVPARSALEQEALLAARVEEALG